MASYASVGDLILAEPAAMIGFAGPRVIKDTTQAELPPGFQTAEFLLEHGLIDAIVPRKELKERLVYYLDFLTEGKRQSATPG
jgi:acetyl-CoA carboxylase carboxyl transferase subunit beta